MNHIATLLEVQQDATLLRFSFSEASYRYSISIADGQMRQIVEMKYHERPSIKQIRLITVVAGRLDIEMSESLVRCHSSARRAYHEFHTKQKRFYFV